jgi:membrane fusion protein (multidrug efflux system)
MQKISALLILVLMLATNGCGKKIQQQPSPATPVVAAEVLVRDQPVYSEYIGQTRGSTEVEIRARVEGFLESINFQEGLFVKKGDLLYVIDPRPYEATLAEAQGRLAREQAAWAQAKQDLSRFEPLIKKNAISRQEYDQAVATERSNAAAVEAAQAQKEAAQLQLSYTKIIAPVDGRIGKSEVQVGNLVGRGQNTLLTTISTINPINVRFSVSEKEHLEWIRTHPNEAQSREATKGLFRLMLGDGSIYPEPGSLVFADRTVDPATGTLLIEVSFANPNNILRPGLYARVLFPKEIIKNAILVPQRAVQELQANYSVWVVTTNQTAELRPVQVGARVGPLWVIQSGLKSKDRIVVEGIQKVQPGLPLKVTMTKIQKPETDLPVLGLVP